jgi:hypothetical protein
LELLNLAKREFVSQCFSSLKHIAPLYEKEMDKNSSIVFCVQSQLVTQRSLDNALAAKLDLLKKAIYEVEEDPYFFKKYVLAYSNEQVESILPEITETLVAHKSVVHYLHAQLNNSDVFRNYKHDPTAQKQYDLVCKLFIKLPFLKLENLEVGTLRRLKDKIAEELSLRKLALNEDLILYLSELQTSQLELRDLDSLLARLE